MATFTKSSKPDIKTSQGLYQLATQNNLKAQADRIMKQQQGEENKKIFSGGFISDIFDGLNALQYGVTGVLKGKSFMEGVKTRQSFSDKDALGDKGIPGMIAGIGLDIAVDPLTYIAPYTILKKIPGAIKVGKAVKSAAFGKIVEKSVKTGEGVKKISQLEGGTKAGKWFAEKFSWMFGADPIFKETYERGLRNIGRGTENLVDMTKGIVNLVPETAAKILTRDKTGRFIRTPIETLKKVLKPEELEPVLAMYNKLEELGQEAVRLKLLSKSKYEEGIGEYIKNAYLEFEQAKGKLPFGRAKVGVKGIKKRVEGLTTEKMAELGQIDNPAYLLFKSTFDLFKDVENTKLFNTISKQFGSDIAQEGFKQLPKTRRLFTSATGEKVEMLGKIKNLNKQLRPALQQLKQTFKADRQILSKIAKLESEIGGLSKLRADEFFKFFQQGQKASKIIPKGRTIRGIGKILSSPMYADEIKSVATKIDSFKGGFDDLMKSDIGKTLDQLDINGILERSGFKTTKELFDFIKKPFTSKAEKVGEVLLKGDLDKLVRVQTQIEELGRLAENVKGIDKASINDSFINLEKTINGIKGEKEGIFEQIGKVKLGELSGKYVPEYIHKIIGDITDPIKDTFGKKLVAGFKYGKVILNPATHARNVASNSLLNWWKLGLGPWRADIYAEAVKNVAKGGKWLDEAKTTGFNIDTFVHNELKGILDGPEMASFGRKFGSKWSKVKQKIADVYQGEENIAKMAAFIHQRKKGIGIEEAWKAAESATFNYAQVTPFIRKLRTNLFGFPFITFTVKATPIAVETALKAPHRISVIGKIKNGLEQQADIKTTARERASEPPWIKDGFYVKLPMKDKHGRSAYFDLTYIIPFGDLMAGNFFERQTQRETGLPEAIPSALMSKSPVLNVLKELSRNQDFYGDKVWNDSDSQEKQLGDIMRHLSKTYLPPLVADQIPGGYKYDGTRRQKGIVSALKPDQEIKQQRTLMQEMLRNVGAKIQPIDVDLQENYQEWNTKKALTTLMLEQPEDILKEFSTTYIPKEK